GLVVHTALLRALLLASVTEVGAQVVVAHLHEHLPEAETSIPTAAVIALPARRPLLAEAALLVSEHHPTVERLLGFRREKSDVVARTTVERDREGGSRTEQFREQLVRLVLVQHGFAVELVVHELV